MFVAAGAKQIILTKRQDRFYNELVLKSLDEAEKLELTTDDVIEMIKQRSEMSAMNAILTCSNLSKSYGRTEAVRNLELQLEENTIYGLLGRNGAGKTTPLI